jgi:hypothetical protein
MPLHLDANSQPGYSTTWVVPSEMDTERTSTTHIVLMKQWKQGPHQPVYQFPFVPSPFSGHTSCSMENKKGFSSCILIFSSLLRVYAGFLGHNRVCTLADCFLPMYIHGMSLDRLHTCRATLFRRAYPLKNKRKCIMKELKCGRGTFVLTWFERKFVSSFEALRINFFSKGDFLPFGQFPNCNGENELPTSIYRLFWPFLPLF